MSDPPIQKDSPALPLETPVPLENLARLMRRAWIWTKRIAVSAIILGGAVLMLEAVHLHQLLGSVHPALAWTVSGLLIAAVLGLSAWMLWRYLRVPPVITPPELPRGATEWTPHEKRAYLKFARRYLKRQQANPALDDAQRAAIDPAQQELATIETTLAASPADPAVATAALIEHVESSIDRILEPLDRQARKEVWASATQVAAITAVNPSSMLDVLITFLRNLELIVRLANLYYNRPGVIGSAQIARDVLAVAATAGIVDRIADGAGSVISEVMGSWTARLAGPVGQGLTNGMLTLRLGDAAVHRCRALRSRRVGIKPWSRTMWREAARRLSASVAGDLAPELGRAFKQIAQGGSSTAGRSFQRAGSWLRDWVGGGSPSQADPVES